MNKDLTKYGSYTTADFALDDDFIQWVWNPDADGDALWQQVKKEFPDQAGAMEDARKIVLSFDVHHQDVSEEIKSRIWQEVLRSSGNGKIVALSRKSRNIWIAAASLMLIAFSASTYLLIHRKSKADLPAIAKNEKPADIAPGGNKAILTLADGSKIILDSANNGAITKQGNITVIKLNDGEIAYKSSTLNLQSSMVSYNTITTPRGGQYQLVLADGSKVWLNAESSLRFPTSFPANERKVELTGEGYFEVAHNASKPFRVSVNDMTVEVLGTHFNINAYKDEDAIKTTLLQGSVQVSEGKESVKIKPGQQARLEAGDRELRTISDVNVDAVVAWKNGLFQFNNTDIQTVMREIGRWYNVKVIYPEGIPGDKYWGSIRRDQKLSDVLRVLKESGAHFKIVGRELIVTVH